MTYFIQQLGWHLALFLSSAAPCYRMHHWSSAHERSVLLMLSLQTVDAEVNPACLHTKPPFTQWLGGDISAADKASRKLVKFILLRKLQYKCLIWSRCFTHEAGVKGSRVGRRLQMVIGCHSVPISDLAWRWRGRRQKELLLGSLDITMCMARPFLQEL